MKKNIKVHLKDGRVLEMRVRTHESFHQKLSKKLKEYGVSLKSVVKICSVL